MMIIIIRSVGLVANGAAIAINILILLSGMYPVLSGLIIVVCLASIISLVTSEIVLGETKNGEKHNDTETTVRSS